jgi:hypothetical protein
LTKGGDACTTCHAAELETIGNKIVAGGKIEPTPIPGKRGTVGATIQATIGQVQRLEQDYLFRRHQSLSLSPRGVGFRNCAHNPQNA